MADAARPGGMDAVDKGRADLFLSGSRSCRCPAAMGLASPLTRRVQRPAGMKKPAGRVLVAGREGIELLGVLAIKATQPADVLAIGDEALDRHAIGAALVARVTGRGIHGRGIGTHAHCIEASDTPISRDNRERRASLPSPTRP